MACKIIKRVNVKATFPGGRVIAGFAPCHPQRTEQPFQIWLREGSADCVLVNPSLAETVEISFEYEK